MMNKKHYRLIVIAGTGSGCGKTSIATGLIVAFRNRGLTVQPFKVGPDYLDPSWHTLAASRASVNLDTWMSSPEYVINLVERKMADADIGIIEGVMGLYDGASTGSLDGSTAEITRLLNAEVILVVNSHGMSRSFAAVVNGFIHFPDAPEFAGIIANHCGSENHIRLLDESLKTVNIPPLLGAIKRDSFTPLPSRHLGLFSALSTQDATDIIKNLSETCEKAISIDSILAHVLPVSKDTTSPDLRKNSPVSGQSSKVRIGIAQDNAFGFYYNDTFDLLTDAGAELIQFSPVNDRSLPDSLDGLYFGGGYPEAYAKELSLNTGMLDSMPRYSAADNVIFAECGGFMYLGNGIRDTYGHTYEMTGIFNFSTEMNTKLKRLGYCEIVTAKDTILGEEGTPIKGHEFHYSSIIDGSGEHPDNAFEVTYRNGQKSLCGYAKGNILGSYMHIHWGSNDTIVNFFLNRCRSTTR
jgi:cobyrinic acid a,c-diamide synthase